MDIVTFPRIRFDEQFGSVTLDMNIITFSAGNIWPSTVDKAHKGILLHKQKILNGHEKILQDDCKIRE